MRKDSWMPSAERVQSVVSMNHSRAHRNAATFVHCSSCALALPQVTTLYGVIQRMLPGKKTAGGGARAGGADADGGSTGPSRVPGLEMRDTRERAKQMDLELLGDGRDVMDNPTCVSLTLTLTLTQASVSSARTEAEDASGVYVHVQQRPTQERRRQPAAAVARGGPAARRPPPQPQPQPRARRQPGARRAETRQ